MSYRHLLFDADGTLLDFAAAQRDAFFALMRHLGIAADESMLHTYDRINQGLWEQLEQREVTREEVLRRRFCQFAERYGLSFDPDAANRFYLGALSQGAALIPGARALLERLSPHFSLAIVSNGVAATQRRRLALAQIDCFFDPIVVSQDAGFEKPDPRFFTYALERCGIADASAALVIGDSLTADIAGARAAGLDCCWFNPSGKTPPLDVAPTYTIHALDELSSIVLSAPALI